MELREGSRLRLKKWIQAADQCSMVPKNGDKLCYGRMMADAAEVGEIKSWEVF